MNKTYREASSLSECWQVTVFCSLYNWYMKKVKPSRPDSQFRVPQEIFPLPVNDVEERVFIDTFSVAAYIS
jgi:hypothetical protein